MATIQCKKCGRRIMAKEKVCPHCGEPVPHDMFDFSLPKFMKKDENKKNHFHMDNSNEQPTEQEKEPPKTNENLITCKACGEKISKNAESCPHCGEPVNSIAKSHDAVEDYVELAGKSRLLSFILTLLLGPLGLLYSSIVWGIIMIVIAVATSPTGVGPFVVWILSIIMGDSMTHNYNKKLYAQAELMHSR